MLIANLLIYTATLLTITSQASISQTSDLFEPLIGFWTNPSPILGESSLPNNCCVPDSITISNDFSGYTATYGFDSLNLVCTKLFGFSDSGSFDLEPSFTKGISLSQRQGPLLGWDHQDSYFAFSMELLSEDYLLVEQFNFKDDRLECSYDMTQKQNIAQASSRVDSFEMIQEQREAFRKITFIVLVTLTLAITVISVLLHNRKSTDSSEKSRMKEIIKSVELIREI